MSKCYLNKDSIARFLSMLLYRSFLTTIIKLYIMITLLFIQIQAIHFSNMMSPIATSSVFGYIMQREQTSICITFGLCRPFGKRLHVSLHKCLSRDSNLCYHPYMCLACLPLNQHPIQFQTWDFQIESHSLSSNIKHLVFILKRAKNNWYIDTY